MSHEIETYKTKLALAYRAGYSGDAAVNYADLIYGDTVEEATAYAERLHSVTAALAAANRRPADEYTPDDKNDVDPVDAATRAAFADAIGPHL